MDSITQAVLGAAASQAFFSGKLKSKAWKIGAVAGSFADLDVFIRSASDPLLAIKYHRHFTHSLFFIPVGALFVTLLFCLIPSFRKQAKWVYLASLIAYATHAPLDLFTSYGTQLFWPLTDHRYALDAISIIDPIFSLPLILGVIWSAFKLTPFASRKALLFCTLYLGFGLFQQHRASVAQAEIIAQRGHPPVHRRVMPTLGNLAVWRSVYRTEEKIYTDAVRISYLGNTSTRAGDDVPIFDPSLTLQNHPDLADELAIFSWYADGFLAQIPDMENEIGDLRYAAATERAEPLWALRLQPSQFPPVAIVIRTEGRLKNFARLWQDLWKHPLPPFSPSSQPD